MINLPTTQDEVINLEKRMGIFDNACNQFGWHTRQPFGSHAYIIQDDIPNVVLEQMNYTPYDPRDA